MRFILFLFAPLVLCLHSIAALSLRCSLFLDTALDARDSFLSYAPIESHPTALFGDTTLAIPAILSRNAWRYSCFIFRQKFYFRLRVRYKEADLGMVGENIELFYDVGTTQNVRRGTTRGLFLDVRATLVLAWVISFVDCNLIDMTLRQRTFRIITLLHFVSVYFTDVLRSWQYNASIQDRAASRCR